MDSRWRSANNIVLIRLDSLGDVLVTTPAIHAVRETLPNARITLLASSAGAQAGRLNPDLDDVVVYEAPWMSASGIPTQNPEREFEMVRLLKSKAFDGAIIFTSYHQSSLPAAYLCYLAGIPLRHAASIDGPGDLLTSRHRSLTGIVHEVEHGLDLVAGAGFSGTDKDLVLRIGPAEESRATQLFEDAGIGSDEPIVVIHPGCNVQARTYHWDGYVKVADLVRQRIGGRIVFTGSPAEVELVEKIQGWTRYPSVSVAGKTDLGSLAAIISRADLVITNNTGPMHVAAAMKTPVVALFALTNPPEQWGPWMVSHRVLNKPAPCAYCYNRVCPVGHECLTLVTPEEVLDAAEELLRETGRRTRSANASVGST